MGRDWERDIEIWRIGARDRWMKAEWMKKDNDG